MAYTRNSTDVINFDPTSGDFIKGAAQKNSDAIDDLFTNLNTHEATVSTHDDWPSTTSAGGKYLRRNAGNTAYEFGDVNAYVAAYVASNSADTLLSNLASNATAQTNLGGTTVGRALFTAAAASNARSTLGLVIGTHVQAYSASLIDATTEIARPSADLTATGLRESVTVGASVVFGDVLCLASNAKWVKADADAATTMPALRMALESKSADQSCKVLIRGVARNDAWNWTIGNGTANFIYVSTTEGSITQTAPSGSGDQVQIVGNALTADVMEFSPSPVMVEIT